MCVGAIVLMDSPDTYTAQATVGDVNRGLSNHKVCISRNQVPPTAQAFIRISNLPTNRSSYLVTVTAGEVPWLLCLRM